MPQYICKSTDELTEIAERLLSTHPQARVFAFRGEMGAGKTTFIKRVCVCLGANEPVTSPTFAIVNEYLAPKTTIYHFDFYRLKNSAEAINIGFEDYINSGGYCLMEWPEIIEDILPEQTVLVTIEVNDQSNERIFTF
jgi:tRNA threonylcarbamoyladenosine biosynthesis protein TsaE